MSKINTSQSLLAVIIGHRIHEIRQTRHLSQSRIAHGIIGQSMMSQIESGRQLPSVETLRLISERLSDPILNTYVEMLQTGNMDLELLSSKENEELACFLTSNKTAWTNGHLQLASQLCEHYYATDQYEALGFLSEAAIINGLDETWGPIFLYYHGTALLFMGNNTKSLSVLSQAEHNMSSLSNGMRARLLYSLGYIYCQLDIYGAAMWYVQQSKSEFLQLSDLPGYASSLGLLGTVQSRLGRHPDAQKSFEGAYEIMLKCSSTDQQLARMELNLANVCESLNASKEAETWCKMALGRDTDDMTRSSLHSILARVNLGTGNSFLTVHHMRQACDSADLSNDPRTIAMTYILASGILPTPEQKIASARRAYDVTISCYELQHALACEILSTLYIKYHIDLPHADDLRNEAMISYRAYISKEISLSKALEFTAIDRENE
ncbi:helix-turn-helix transcriptional regulator [Alicyclobacillus sp. ALC3]|uniref:helix-turn-helix transcriptional regulator n=1 Tax=Alicyclobacillus sp. ALC3 TaxID=2796143 RepID=UPI002377F222|nr:helix-turn-helix transcriptional regulator [Alicyclobacillus sp. ALC3]WDL97928.1 helix-turn-helix transcriptional regulator [Alicyclobacillus sp. ALC3]